MSNNFFNLVSICPVGFKEKKFQGTNCSYCGGFLKKVCDKCISTNTIDCKIINIEGDFYHEHCYMYGKNK